MTYSYISTKKEPKVDLGHISGMRSPSSLKCLICNFIISKTVHNGLFLMLLTVSDALDPG